MVDRAFIGKKYQPVRYEVGKEKIREYAKAIGDMNPLYHDDEAAAASKYGAIIAPPTFAVVYDVSVFENVLFDKELKINMMMVVHGEMDFEFGEVVRTGDVITSVAEVEDIYDKKGHEFIVVKIISKNQHDQMTAIGTAIFVVRGS